MKTLTISVSELELNKFGIKKDQLSFSEFVEIVGKELARQHLNKSIEFAEKYDLSKLSMEDITEEVKAVRNNAKNHS